MGTYFKTQKQLGKKLELAPYNLSSIIKVLEALRSEINLGRLAPSTCRQAGAPTSDVVQA